MSLWREFRESISSVINMPADYFGGWMGMAPSDSGVEVNELTAMQIAAYVGCVRLISGAVSTMSLRVWERLPDGSERIAKEHGLDNVLNKQPNSDVSAADFLQTAQTHLLMTGNAYAEIAYNGAGQAAGLYLRNPFQTIPYRRKTGELFYKTKDGAPGYEREIPAENMVHIKGLGMDSLVGLSPVKYYAREVLGNDLAAQSYSAKFFANDSRPGGYLKSTGFLANEKKTQAVSSWMAAHSRGNSHRMALLDGGVTWEKVGVNPEEAQFLQTRVLNAKQIGVIFGVPFHFLGGSEESRANMEQRGIEFLTFTIRPWLAKWEQGLDMRLFPTMGRNAGRYFARFDTTTFERATYADLLRGVQMGRYAGIYTINEGRKLLGEQPYSEKQLASKDPADKLWMPVNLAYVSRDISGTSANGGDGQGQGGNDQGGGDGAGTTPSAGTSQGGKRSTQDIKRYFQLFSPTFRDAFGRILSRKKPDDGDFQKTFGPVLIQIASVFSFRADAEPGDMALPEPIAEFVRDYISALSKRAGEWTKESADIQAAQELKRAIEVLQEKCSKVEVEESSDHPETIEVHLKHDQPNITVPITLHRAKKRKIKLLKTADGTTTGAEVTEE